jgi:hypothetical protein
MNELELINDIERELRSKLELYRFKLPNEILKNIVLSVATSCTAERKKLEAKAASAK